MATKNTTQKDKKEGLKGILVTAFFVVVFVCAFFGMDVEKNTPMQFIDKMLSGDIVENASKTAKNVKEIVTPLQSLLGGEDTLSSDTINFKDLSSITETLGKLNELKETYNQLKDNDALKSVLGISDDEDVEKAEDLVSTESNFIDNSINFFSFLKDNQEEISYNADGSLQVDDSIKSVFESLFNSWTDSESELENSLK